MLTPIPDLPATVIGVEAHGKDFTARAAWEDTKLGVGRFHHWERIAVVGDADWLRRAIHALSWAMPGEVKVFSSDERDEARAWVTS